MIPVEINARIMQRHPELSEGDVLSAWENVIVSAPRVSEGVERCVAIGSDSNGRLIELVAARTSDTGWIIYHAMTPPSRKTLFELKLTRR